MPNTRLEISTEGSPFRWLGEGDALYHYANLQLEPGDKMTIKVRGKRHAVVRKVSTS